MSQALYDTVFVRPWPWWAGGVAIGLLVPALYYMANKGLGASTGYGSILRLFPAAAKLKWVSRNLKQEFGWRFFLLIGMILGGFASARFSGRPLFTLNMGYLNLPGVALTPPGVAALLFAGGFLLGFGARIAGGCTSGHSIHGISTMQVSGLITSAAFFGAGIAATWLLVRPLLGGQ